MEKQFVCTLCNERFEERAPIEHGLAEHHSGDSSERPD